MAPPHEKLAESLAVLKELQDQRIVAIRSSNLSRTHRERLLKSGFLQEVMKGWYIAANPHQRQGETTGWYASFWDFCASYLSDRFGKDWCIAPEPSIALHTGNRTVPGQLLVRSPVGGNKPTSLLHGTSIFDLPASTPAILPNQTAFVSTPLTGGAHRSLTRLLHAKADRREDGIGDVLGCI